MARLDALPARLLSKGSGPLDWVFIPLTAQWIVVNELVYPAYGTFLYRLGTFQVASNPIFPVTWGAALALFVFGAAQFRVRYGVDYVRSFAYAFGLALAATSLFEIIYQNVGAGQGIGNQSLVGQVINASSIAMAFSSLRFWQPSRLVLGAAIVYLCGWLFWLSAGYPQIYSSDPARAMLAFDFNAPLKAGSYVLLGLLVSKAPPPRNRGGLRHGYRGLSEHDCSGHSTTDETSKAGDTLSTGWLPRTGHRGAAP